MDTDSARPLVLTNQVQASQPYYLELLRSLVAAGANGEEAVQQEIGKRLALLGCSVETLRREPNHYVLPFDFATEPPPVPPERPSVVSKLTGAGDGRSILMFAHPDTEPISNPESWQHDAFAGEIVDDRMYGWGIADDLAGVAAMICGLDAVVSSGLKPLGDVVICSTASKRRAQGIYAVLEAGYTADASIYLHPAESGDGLGDIKTASAGLLRFRITVTGKPPETHEPTHTPFYHKAVNPIDKAWVVYHALNTLAEQRAQTVKHPAFEEVGRATNLHISHIQAGEASKASRVASSAVMTGSLSFPPGEDISGVKQQVEAAITEAAASDTWLSEHPPQLQWLMGTNGVEVPLDSPIYQTVRNAIHAVTGITPQPQPLHSGSDIRAPILYSGIPTIGFGPLCGDLTQAGGTDEWVSVEDYMHMIEVVAMTIVNWCGTAP
jgi:acetylornithine deacetylase